MTDAPSNLEQVVIKNQYDLLKEVAKNSQQGIAKNNFLVICDKLVQME